MSIAQAGSELSNSQFIGQTSVTVSSVSVNSGDLVIAQLTLRTGGTAPTGISLKWTSDNAALTIPTPFPYTAEANHICIIAFYQAAASRTNDSVQANWTNASNARISVTRWTGAQDPTSLVSGTDYATGTNHSGVSSTALSVTVTPKGSNSQLVGNATLFDNAATFTAGANTTTFGQANGGGSHVSFESSSLVSSSTTLNETSSVAERWAMVAMELLAAGAALNPGRAYGATKTIGGVF